MSGLPALPPLPNTLGEALSRASLRVPHRAGARALVGDIAGARALPLSGLQSLGYARCLLLAGDAPGARIWGEIATDRLGAEARLLEALEAQIVVARAQSAQGRWTLARGCLRGVASAVARLYPEGDPEGPEAAPFARLRARFALAAGELRLSQGEAEAGIALMTSALEGLDEGAESLPARLGLGVGGLMAGDVSWAVSQLMDAASLARELGAEEEALEASLAAATGAQALGRQREGRALAEAGERLALKLGDRAALMALRVLGAEAGGDGAQALKAMETAAELGAPWTYAQMVLLIARQEGARGGPEARGEILLSGALALLAQGRFALAEVLRAELMTLAKQGVALEALLTELALRIAGREG